MSALAWPLVVMGCLGWVLAAAGWIGHVIRWLRQTAKTPAPAVGQPPRVPGQTPARANPPQPGPAPNRAEATILNGIQRARVTASPTAVENSRLIADGLRLRFPHLHDTVLGLIVFDISGYLHAALQTGDPRILAVLGDAFSLSAEELTRLARQEVPR